jgi:hypothetical protein
MRHALVSVSEQITAAHTSVREAIKAYNLIPDELKVWRRHV